MSDELTDLCRALGLRHCPAWVDLNGERRHCQGWFDHPSVCWSDRDLIRWLWGPTTPIRVLDLERGVFVD